MAEQSRDNTVLLEVIDCGFNKKSWHGPNLMQSINGLTAKEAAWHPRGRKSIWQHVLHAAFWKDRVTTKLLGIEQPDIELNWEKVGVVSGKSWSAALARLKKSHQRLRSAVRKALPSSGQKEKWVFHGVALHDIYHAGQIQLLRKLMGKP